LFADEKVKFGNDTPGGTRISRLSHIDGTQHAPILVSQGKPGTYKVDPLPEAAPALTDAMIACATDLDQLRSWFKQHPAQRAAIEARVADIKAADALPVDVAPSAEEPAGGAA
jgi:hypothetical protein